MADPQRSLAGIGLLLDLSERARGGLEQRCRWYKYVANDQIIDRESDSRDVYFIVEGRVRVVNYSLSGREVTFDELAAGAHFGELAALDGEPRSANVVALTETRVASVSPQTFTNLFLDNPTLGLKMATMFARIVRTSTDRIMDLSTLGAHNRVHSEILREAREYSSDDNAAEISPIPVHSDIAARASTTRETVARVLSDLAKQGLVTREKDALVVRDVARLEQMVEHLRHQL